MVNALQESIYGVQEQNRIMAHRDVVYSVSFSSDGQTVASAIGDRTIKLWNSDGQLRQTITGHRDTGYSVAFSPDNQRLASGSADGTIKLWDQNGILLQTLNTQSNSSPTVIAEDKTHDSTLESIGQAAKNHCRLQPTCFGVKFSPDGRICATASGDTVLKLWNLDSTLLQAFQGHQDGLLDLSFSPDGNAIASSAADRTVRLWRGDGTTIAILRGHGDVVHGIGFSADGKTLASTSNDNTVILWDLANLSNLEGLITKGCDGWART